MSEKKTKMRHFQTAYLAGEVPGTPPYLEQQRLRQRFAEMPATELSRWFNCPFPRLRQAAIETYFGNQTAPGAR